MPVHETPPRKVVVERKKRQKVEELNLPQYNGERMVVGNSRGRYVVPERDNINNSSKPHLQYSAAVRAEDALKQERRNSV
jgi:hypothetical protein